MTKIFARNNSPFIPSHQAFRYQYCRPCTAEATTHTHTHTRTHTYTKWSSILPQAGSIPTATIELCRSFCFRISRSRSPNSITGHVIRMYTITDTNVNPISNSCHTGSDVIFRSSRQALIVHRGITLPVQQLGAHWTGEEAG